MNRPKIVIRSTSAKVKKAQLGGIVTVGPESAKLLSEKLGREVKVGEQFDLGVIAELDSNPFKNFLAQVRVAMNNRKNNLFAKPLKNGD